MRIRTLLLGGFIFFVAATAARATCGLTAVCADVTADFVGTIDGSSVVLTWSTDNETAALASYQVRRFNCQNPNSCSVFVATVTPSGTCGTMKYYTYTDTPPTPVTSWIYTLEVWTAGNGTRFCAADTTPQ